MPSKRQKQSFPSSLWNSCSQTFSKIPSKVPAMEFYSSNVAKNRAYGTPPTNCLLGYFILMERNPQDISNFPIKIFCRSTENEMKINKNDTCIRCEQSLTKNATYI